MSVLSTWLEIAIVLCAIYVALSCLCSAVNEQIASFAKLRGAKLFAGILNLLVGERALAEAIFRHPLIADSSDDRDGTIAAAKTYRPSYVDARNFSMAFWQSFQERQPLPAGSALAATLASPHLTIGDLTTRVDAMQSGDLKRALSSLLFAADGDYQRLLAVTDGWFNAQMDRVSGWYKRQSQAVLAIVAAVVVIVSGIDSIEIGTKLYFDRELRASVVDGIVAAMPQKPGGTADAARVAESVDRQLQHDLAGFVHPPTTWGRGEARHVPGMIVTFLALLLGGPFWFDALSGLVNVRLAGRKPERGDQPPK